MARYVIHTLGCKANQYQGEALKSKFEGRSLKFGEEADIYIINTCTVTLDAERKSRQAIRRALRLAKKVYVTGCSARLEKDKLRSLFPSIEFLDPLPLRSTFYLSRVKSRDPLRSKLRIRENLMIEDGCENFCSYCVVPFARGKVQRKPLETIVEEARIMAEGGVREIVLTGINLGAWGNLIPVLYALLSNSNLFRIRLSSIEPQYVTDELVELIAKESKLCKHLHIPLQSGDNKILKLMNRKYSAEEYLSLAQRIKKAVPGIGLTTDIIVGFPGEGENEFQNTVGLIRKIGFSRLHIFPYSKRELTAAAKLPGQVDGKEKKRRFAILNELREKQMKEFNRKYLGKEVEILIEKDGEGLTSNYIRVKLIK